MMRLLLSILAFNLSLSWAQTPFYEKDGVFIKGHDPVSYIKSNKAIKGNEEIQLTYKGVKIYFSSNENKNSFIKNPKKYLPAYNGYCAYAMASGELVEINPKSFRVLDGRVYLFFKNWFVDTLSKWKRNESKLKDKADAFWQTKFVKQAL